MQNTEFNRLKLLLDTLYFPLSGGRINGKTIFTKLVSFCSADKKKVVSIQNGMIEGANVSYFGICDAEQGAKQFKSVKIQGVEDFALRVGTSIAVKFATTNSFPATQAAPIALDVNGTGVKNIYYDTGIPTGTDIVAFGKANTTNFYMYDGTYWVFVGSGSGSGGEGHTYDLTQSSDNTEITLTEDGADKTTVRAMRTTAEVKSLMLELCYPVGSIYISTKNVSPQTFLGGTWTRKSGYMLRGATSGVNFNSNTNDGGADSVTVSSVASHNHTQNPHSHSSLSVAKYNDYGNIGQGTYQTFPRQVTSSPANLLGTNDATATNIANGANYTVNTLPKYKNVYIWERTA